MKSIFKYLFRLSLLSVIIFSIFAGYLGYVEVNNIQLDIISNWSPEQVVGVIFGSAVILMISVVGRVMYEVVFPLTKKINNSENAKGKILEIRRTGWRVNQVDMQLEIKLEIYRNNMPSYVASTIVMASGGTESYYKVGMEVDVLVDSKNPQNIKIKSIGSGFGTPVNAQDIKNEILETLKTGGSGKYIIEGKLYNSLEEMPPDIRKKAEASQQAAVVR